MTNSKTIKKRGLPFPLRVLVTCALLVAMSFALSWIKLFPMPQGGSITPVSMLPVMLAGYMFGIVPGLLSGLAYGLLQMLQDFYVVHPVQLILDYILAFTVLGLTALFRWRASKANTSFGQGEPSKPGPFYSYVSLPLAVLVAGVARFLMHLISGVYFFAPTYAPGVNPWWYSFAYNGPYMGVEIAICMVIVLIPPVSAAIRYLSRRVATI